MPNYRQKNRKKNNRNRNNKNNHNNNNNNNNNQNKATQEDKPARGVNDQESPQVGNVSIDDTVVAAVVGATTPFAHIAVHQHEKIVNATVSAKAEDNSLEDDDTVSDKKAPHSDAISLKQDAQQATHAKTIISSFCDLLKMGAKNTKQLPDLADEQQNVNDTEVPKTQQVKVVIHRVVVPATSEPNIIEHPITVEEEEEEEQQAEKEHQSTVTIQEVSSEALASSDESEAQNEPIISEVPEYDDMKMKRAQKRVALETHFLPQLLSPRYLDSILEENSDMSDCSDKRSSLDGQEVKVHKANAKFPRSNLNFSRNHKATNNTLPSLQNAICEEPLALIVETKLIERLQHVAEEACSTKSTSHVEPQAEAAEVVFINSSTSSSTSDILELLEEESQVDTVDLDTDANTIISRPCETSQREVTPVNEKMPNETNELARSIEKSEIEGATISETDEDTISEQQLAMLSDNSSSSSTVVLSSSLSSFVPSSGHESSINGTCEQQTTCTIETADLMQSSSYDDISSLVPASSSNSSLTLDASPSLSLKSSVEEVTQEEEEEEENSAEAFERLENTCRAIMDNVREIVHNNQLNGKQLSPSPPPIPPPSVEHANSNSKLNSLVQLSTTNSTGQLERQESLESHCSSNSTNHSQCTAINLNDRSEYDVSSPPPMFSENETPIPHNNHISRNNTEAIQKLRQLCTIKLAALPYGEEVLEELASVAQNMGEAKATQILQSGHSSSDSHANVLQLQNSINHQVNGEKNHEIVHKVIVEDEQLLNSVHGIPFDKTINRQGREITLRKSSSPPPVPPPPVPIKSSETVAKAQQKQQISNNSRIIPIVFAENDVSHRNLNTKEQQTIEKTNEHKTFSMNENKDSGDDISISNKPQQHQHEKNIIKINAKIETASNNTTSSVENNSRRQHLPHEMETASVSQEIYSNHSSSSTKREFKEETTSSTKSEQSRPLGQMQGVESELGRMFPTMGHANIFDGQQKRFSNIESSVKSEPTKRYSNIETHNYESEKRMKNGELVYDYEDSRHELQKQTGDEVDATAKTQTLANDIEKNVQHMRSGFNLNEGKNASHGSEEFGQSAKCHESVAPNRLDQEKLFKDFDDLSQQLHRELETGRVQREQREKSASLYDLNNRNYQQHLDDMKRQRHEHMRELEREIERSIKSRQFNRGVSQETTLPRQQQQQQQQQQKVENKTHEIPIRIENYSSSHFEHDLNSPFRRTESLFNLEPNAQAGEVPARPRTSSSNYESQHLYSDDWSHYASDLGSSENISRPIAREMQIVYDRQQPRTIRAPRLTVSTNDLSASLAPPTYDTNNAYNVRRSHAPMMQAAPASRQPNQYSSCYSVLERDPNPTYISTTSRRGVSPAPQPQVHKDAQSNGFNFKPQPQARRASLPREIHEQQLKYICSKEEELRLEFERLQHERRRLLEQLEAEKTQPQQQPENGVESKAGEQQVPQAPPRHMRDVYRSTARLPTLSEHEVFRQQMAEEWLSKVAEREERRLQKIIKISKLHEEHNLEKLVDGAQPDIGQEFLHRVKERRHKLHMPADSDWESGAESQPANTTKANNGQSVDLPSHLREFARFSDEHSEQLANGGNRHVYEEEETSREAMPNSSSSTNKKASVVKTVKISRQPPQVLTPGQDTTTAYTDTNTSEQFSAREFKSDSDCQYSTMDMPSTLFTRKLPDDFDDMFANSPFRERIYEEYDRFWHNFNNHQQSFFD